MNLNKTFSVYYNKNLLTLSILFESELRNNDIFIKIIQKHFPECTQCHKRTSLSLKIYAPNEDRCLHMFIPECTKSLNAVECNHIKIHTVISTELRLSVLMNMYLRKS